MTAAALIDAIPVQIDRTGWARRGHMEHYPEQVLALEVTGNDLNDAAKTLDDWAYAAGGEIKALQHVFRRGKRVLYGRVSCD